MRKAGAGGRQRLEAEALQIARAADVPWIGNDETAALMQRAERAAFVGNRWAAWANPRRNGRDRATITRLRTTAFPDAFHVCAHGVIGGPVPLHAEYSDTEM